MFKLKQSIYDVMTVTKDLVGVLLPELVVSLILLQLEKTCIFNNIEIIPGLTCLLESIAMCFIRLLKAYRQLKWLQEICLDDTLKRNVQLNLFWKQSFL